MNSLLLGVNRHQKRLLVQLWYTVSVSDSAKVVVKPEAFKKSFEQLLTYVIREMPRELTKAELHRQVEYLKIQLNVAHQSPKCFDQDTLVTELEHCKEEKQALELKFAESLEQLHHTTLLPLSEKVVLESGHKISVLESASHAKCKTSKSNYSGHDSSVTEAWGSPQKKSLSTDNTAELQQGNEYL